MKFGSPCSIELLLGLDLGAARQSADRMVDLPAGSGRLQVELYITDGRIAGNNRRQAKVALPGTYGTGISAATAIRLFSR